MSKSCEMSKQNVHAIWTELCLQVHALYQSLLALLAVHCATSYANCFWCHHACMLLAVSHAVFGLRHLLMAA